MNLRTALRLGRVSNLPTIWANVLAGLALSVGVVPLARIFGLCLAMSLLYVGGMYLNDAFDAEFDARVRAERPIPQGLVARRTVFAWGYGMLAAGVVLTLAFGLGPALAALATAGVIVLYDVVHKRTQLSPLLMGACRLGVYLTVALTGEETLWTRALVWSFAVFAYVMGLTYAAARENSSALVRIGPLLGLFSPVVAFVAMHGLFDSPWSLVPLLLLVLWVVRSLKLVRSRVPVQIKRGIGALIAGIALADALFLSAFSPLLAALALTCFLLTLLFQRSIAGT